MTSHTKPMPATGNAPPPPWRLLGELFVERGILTPVSVTRLVEVARSRKVRFGVVLEEVGLVTPEELADALAAQHGCKRVSGLARYNFSRELLRMIPVEVALEQTIFPLKLENGVLGLAVIDPTVDRLLKTIAENHRVRIIPFVATRYDINMAIAKHYLDRDIQVADDNSILLVEDDKLIAEMIATILKKEGYTVFKAVDGMEAFKEIIARKPRVVLTDKEMPKLDGYALLSAIRNIPECRMTPVVLITSSKTPEEEGNALEKGFFDFIPKPINEITLKTRIKRAFSSTNNLYPSLERR
jgi:CheY-like chemotaxis protein